MQVGSIINEVEKCIVELNVFYQDYDLTSHVEVDHIGIKCSSTEIYEQKRKVLEQHSRFVYQSIISQRRISVIGLQNPQMTYM